MTDIIKEGDLKTGEVVLKIGNANIKLPKYGNEIYAGRLFNVLAEHKNETIDDGPRAS